jgi:hypothetical protein
MLLRSSLRHLYLAIVPRLAPRRPHAPQNYAVRIGQCGIAVPDTHTYRILVVQPQAIAGFAAAITISSLSLGRRHGDHQKEKDALLAGLRTGPRKTTAQPRQLQTDNEEAPLTKRKKIPERPRTPTQQLEEVSSRLTAKSGAASSCSGPPHTPPPNIPLKLAASTNDRHAR